MVCRYIRSNLIDPSDLCIDSWLDAALAKLCLLRPPPNSHPHPNNMTRPKAGGKTFLAILLLLFMVCYSAMDWVGSIMHPEKIHIDDTYTYHDPYMHDGDGIDESYLSEISHSISSNPVDPIPLPEGANSSLEEDAQQKNEEATLQNKNLKVLNETITISGVTDVPLFDNKDNVSVNTQVQDMNIQEKIPLNITGEKNLTQANNEYPPGNNTAFNSAIKPANTTFKTKTYFAQRRSI